MQCTDQSVIDCIRQHALRTGDFNRIVQNRTGDELVSGA